MIEEVVQFLVGDVIVPGHIENEVFVMLHTSYILSLKAASSASMATLSTHVLLSCVILFFISMSL